MHRTQFSGICAAALTGLLISTLAADEAGKTGGQSRRHSGSGQSDA